MNVAQDCLSCGASMSEPAETEQGFDRLFCVVKQEYVADDSCCEEYN